MELSAENSQNCVFKLLPRYKVRSVGDEVSSPKEGRAQMKDMTITYVYLLEIWYHVSIHSIAYVYLVYRYICRFYMYLHDQTEIKHDVYTSLCIWGGTLPHVPESVLDILQYCLLFIDLPTVWCLICISVLASCRVSPLKGRRVSCWVLHDWILPESRILGLIQWLLVNFRYTIGVVIVAALYFRKIHLV